MKHFFALLLISLPVGCFAQQYLITYDIHNKNINYFSVDNKDTSKIKNIDPSKNRRIILQVDNYNPFYWNARVTAFKNPVDEEVGYGNAFNPISVLAGGLGNIMGGLPKLDLPQNRGGLSRGNMDDATFNFVETADKYAGSYEDVQTMNNKLEELKIVKLQLKELKYDFIKTENIIKASAKDVVTKSLGTDKLDLVNVLEIGKNYNSKLNNAIYAAGNQVKDLKQQIKTVNPQLIYEDKTLADIELTASRSYSQLSYLKQQLDNDPNLILNEVAEIAQLYKDISSANYHFSYAINNEDAITDLKLELYSKVAEGANDTLVQYFELSKKKNIKIRNSVGVSFSYFDENNRNYFIGADSTIRSGKKDLFVPLLSTFIHFYAGKSMGVKWGGALGFGIPLQGQQKDINFLLGITAGIGKNEPILITAGVAGAQVKKLNDGFKVGAYTSETNPDNLTTSGYGLGGFLGVSFNLSGVIGGKNKE